MRINFNNESIFINDGYNPGAMKVEVSCYNCGEPITEHDHSQVIGRLIHCGNCGSFNSVEDPLQTI